MLICLCYIDVRKIFGRAEMHCFEFNYVKVSQSLLSAMCSLHSVIVGEYHQQSHCVMNTVEIKLLMDQSDKEQSD